MVVAADFSLVVETDRVDHQRIAFPASNRVAHPCRVRVGLMRLAVERNDPERSGIFVHENQGVVVLNDLELVWNAESIRRTQGHTVRGSTNVLCPAIHFVFFRAGFQHRSATGSTSATSASTAAESINTREVGFAVRRSRSAFLCGSLVRGRTR